MKLLIVDDHPELLRVLSAVAKLFGHAADEAGDGLAAIKLLERNRYDVLITDAEMPGMNGMELCRHVKMHYPDVHVIGMSGSLYAVKDLQKAGADNCLVKPFGIDELRKALENRFHSPLSDLTSLQSVA